MTKRKRPGRVLEEVVAAIEKALSSNQRVRVQSPTQRSDRVTGEAREIDVLVTVSGGHHSSTIAIECRDRSRKVTVNDVESFWAKCQDTGIDQGIIVSPKGFSKAATAKAAHRGLRCLALEEAQSFNWLLASGVWTRTRRVIGTDWTFDLASEVVPPPTNFDIISAGGKVIPASSLGAAAYSEFQKIPDDGKTVGRSHVSILFNAPGISLRDATTGVIHTIATARVTMHFDRTEELIPFRLSTYVDTGRGTHITDAALADISFGTVKGKLAIVFNEVKGGSVVYVPDPSA